ncbi:pentatricopeptide repeat-containing protein At2g44880-like [Silene latifolia]|uniref:pentatricopeptide repeat-containing protein At2g44880-like n=1 Tax=Silene latifolia TaxID=37657 RepID=UPI003D77676B
MNWLWSPIERKCISLLQQRQSGRTLLQIHGFIVCNNLDTNLNIITKFIAACSAQLFSKPGIQHARQVFDKIPRKNDTFLCNVMIKSHIGNDQFDEALFLFRDLLRTTEFVPDIYTFLFLSKSCCSSLYKWEGKQLHCRLIRSGFCSDLFVSTSMVDMYAKMGDMGSARKVFDEMPNRSVVSWTALVCGYAKSGDIFNARKYFDEMPDKDVAAYNAIIDACVKVGDMRSAQRLFEMMPQRNVVSWTTMISGFCNNNDTVTARIVFDAMPEKNQCSWNAMIGGYCQNKQPHEALKLFHELLLNRVLEPDEVTIISILPAIADLGALDMGCWVHQYVKRKKLDQRIKISTSLIDMYAKCGEITKAMSVFEKIPRKATCSWNAIINGLAVNGYGNEALLVFDDMIKSGYKPNSVTMIGVLSACSHSGLVKEGKKWLKDMEKFGLTPQIEHYGCVIDLFGRIGDLDEAEKVLHSMPYEANEIVISSFLSACVNRKDLFRAERVLNEAVKVNPLNAGNYVLLRNLYAMENKWTEVRGVNGLMRDSGAKKEAGFSAIEANGMLWEFVSGGLTHPRFDDILLVLRHLQMHMNMEEECILAAKLG